MGRGVVELRLTYLGIFSVPYIPVIFSQFLHLYDGYLPSFAIVPDKRICTRSYGRSSFSPSPEASCSNSRPPASPPLEKSGWSEGKVVFGYFMRRNEKMKK